MSEKVNGKPNRPTKSMNIDPKNILCFLFHYLNLRRYVFTTSPTDFPLGFCFEETHTRWFPSAKNLIILEMSVKTLVYPDDKLWFFKRCRIGDRTVWMTDRLWNWQCLWVEWSFVCLMLVEWFCCCARKQLILFDTTANQNTRSAVSFGWTIPPISLSLSPPPSPPPLSLSLLLRMRLTGR